MPTTTRRSGPDALRLALSLGLLAGCTSAAPGNAGDARRVTSLATGVMHTCARFADGAVRCWGYCDVRCGRLGEAGPSPPLRIEALPAAEGIAVGDDHGCAWHADGRVSCWGSNYYGALGIPADIRSPVPVTVSGVEDVVELVARSHDTCARHRDGGVTCWGGIARVADESAEQAAARLPRRIEGVTRASDLFVADEVMVCAREQSGAVGCWSQQERSARIGPPEQFRGVVARPGCNCALLDDGTASCHAFGLPGAMMGDGTHGPAPTLPCSIDRIKNVRELVTSSSFGCALDRAGKVLCWGELALEIQGDRGIVWPGPAPREVAGLSDVTSLVASMSNVCALKSDGSVWCFGQDGFGQISGREGKPTTEPRRVEF
ncbi:Regulator of chromosome condensation (RCC1) repeat-containing protein [Nannocystis exedens]|uniref:Regulator of chromosome condensation (RCC1) repeat-containing protein n=1 Tax=Nannocystis exedens TaxID=54 RepID=A0A1I2CHU9_9BACT|nr:hypothetical protein [Nannocystis exedens]PCC68284.1 Regulator of chromosome condensation (RCC1) repeat protein [Nannocystis exedens]SFE67818.1 Regulator of chromosome condensation (RCC1) repeat-containing protein [Nannocystis exedens]